MEPWCVFLLEAFRNEVCLDLAFWIWHKASRLTVWIAMAVVPEVYRMVVRAPDVRLSNQYQHHCVSTLVFLIDPFLVVV